MVLKRIILVFALLFSLIKAQELFYTDKYMSNFYLADEEVMVFTNNVFQLMNSQGLSEAEGLILSFMDSMNIDAQVLTSPNPRQLMFTYSAESFEPIKWSTVWHSSYESVLRFILKRQLEMYFEGPIRIPESLDEAAIIKLAYYDWQNFKNRTSDFTKTRMAISTLSLDTRQFKKTFIPPNLSLNRIVTNSFKHFYNEAYPVVGLDQDLRFLFGPSNKARLKDCLSMHIYNLQNRSQQPIYLNNQTLLIQAESSDGLVDENWDGLVQAAANQMRYKMNSLSVSFYSIHDLEVFDELVENFTREDYLEFQKIYFVQNSYNLALPTNKLDSTFNKSVLQRYVQFKANSTEFLLSEDSLTLNSLVLFLKANEDVNLLLIGYQNEMEYTKIDIDKFKAFIAKYEDYPPVKKSRGAEIAIFRAVVVFDYLVSQGIHPSRVSCMSSKVQTPIPHNRLVNWVIK